MLNRYPCFEPKSSGMCKWSLFWTGNITDSTWEQQKAAVISFPSSTLGTLLALGHFWLIRSAGVALLNQQELE